MVDVVPKTSNIVAETGNSVEATFDIVERIVKLVAFDNVAWTLLLVWMGLYRRQTTTTDTNDRCYSGPRTLCVGGPVMTY